MPEFLGDMEDHRIRAIMMETISKVAGMIGVDGNVTQSPEAMSEIKSAADRIAAIMEEEDEKTNTNSTGLQGLVGECGRYTG